MSVWTLLLSITAFVAIENGLGSCNFFQVKLTDGSLATNEKLYFGFFGYNKGDQLSCNILRESDREFYFDGIMDALAVLTLIASVASTISMITTIVMSCASCRSCCIKCISVVDVLIAVVCVIGFIGFASDFCSKYNCKMSVGSGLNIVAPILFGAVAWTLFATKPYDSRDGAGVVVSVADIEADEGAPPPGSVQISQEVLPDGTKKTIKKTVNQDGSITVEETVETPN